MTNKAQIAERVKDYGEDSDFIRVRVRGVFPRAGDLQFIDGERVDSAIARELASDPDAPLIMGVDIARQGSDQTVIRFRQGLDAGRGMLRKRGPIWPKCEVPTGAGNVCCWGQTGHTAGITKSTRLTQSGLGGTGVRFHEVQQHRPGPSCSG